MKLACLMIATVFSLFNKGIAHECRVHFDVEKLSVTPEGIILTTEDFGEISLDHVSFDEKGYHAKWKVAFACANCRRELEMHDSLCEDCGCEEVGIVRLDKKDGIMYLKWKLKTDEVKTARKFNVKDVYPSNKMNSFSDNIVGGNVLPQHYGQLSEAFKEASRYGADALGAILHLGTHGDNKGNKSVEASLKETIKDSDGNDRGIFRGGTTVTQDPDGGTTVRYEVGLDYEF